MNEYNKLDPKELTGTPRMSSRRSQDVASGNASGRGTSESSVQAQSATQPTTQKKDCLADDLSQFFNDVKGAITGVIAGVKDRVVGAINDVKDFANGLKNAINCTELEFKLEKIDIRGIFDDIKNGIEQGINDAINYVKGIVDTAKDFKAYLTCEKGTVYEQEEQTIDTQLQRASDENDAAGEAMTKRNFTSGAKGTSQPMSPRKRRDIANGNASGRSYVNNQVKQSSDNTLFSIKLNARKQCDDNNSGKSLTGLSDSLNTDSYG
ncbi:hypothetical protein OAU81_00290 [bacterium]|nr:hypothetical protein [bacterium]